MDITSKLVTINAYGKRKFVANKLLDSLITLSATEKETLSMIVSAIRSKDSDAFYANVAGLLISASGRNVIDLDRFLYEIGNYTSWSKMILMNTRKAILLIVQGAIFWIFTMFGGGV